MKYLAPLPPDSTNFAALWNTVIKIYGIYTHAQIDSRLWDSVGYQLARRGREYRKRVLFRNKPIVAGDRVFTPASFPPVEKVEEEETTFPELPHESLEEVDTFIFILSSAI